MMEEVVGKVTVKQVFFERVRDGGVFVYKIENDYDKYDILFRDFYVAVFVDFRSESVWGVGSNIESALEDAKRNWDREEGDEYPNPFREALEKLRIREAFELAKLNEEDNNVSENY